MFESQKGTVVGGTLLVAGTAIGGGMLALPVLTGPGGFFPATILYTLCWLFMACTGLLLMEVYLWKESEVNLVSMASMTLGRGGKFLAWILYLFLFYSLTIAYIAGGGGLVETVIEKISPTEIPLWLGPLLFVLIFAPFVFIGAFAVDRLNSLLMAGLILSFLGFILVGIFHIDLELLLRSNWLLAFLATPVMFTSFGFQGIVPTLTGYMGRDPFKTKNAILLGSLIPLCIYIIWEAVILGVVPIEHLDDALAHGQSAVYPLKKILLSRWLSTLGQFFAFFAIVTSFLGVTLGLLDFLADGLKIKKNGRGRAGLSVLIFIPPLLFSMTFPDIFLDALQFAGGFGCALLLGLLPILMAWRGRYTLGFKSQYSLPGGRITLSLLLSFIVFELVIMVFNILH